MIGPLSPPVGGMATVVENLLQSLELSCDVRVINNQKTTPVDRSIFQAIYAQLKLLWRLFYSSVFWRPHIVHIHTCSYFTFWRSAIDVLLARICFRKVIVHIHGAEFHKFLLSLQTYKAFAMRFTLNRCTKVVVLGEQWKKVIAPWCHSGKTLVVPNGVPVSEVNIDRNLLTPEIIYLANYEKRKGQKDLITVLKKLEDLGPINLSLLGADYGMQQELIKLADSLQLTGYVDIPGPKRGVDKQHYLDKATLFCMPSYDEGLPMSMLEAMAEGLPLVVTDVGSISEAVKHGRDGLLYQAGNLDALERCLRQVLTDKKFAEKIARNGRKRLEQEFSIAHSAAILLAAYKKISCIG